MEHKTAITLAVIAGINVETIASLVMQLDKSNAELRKIELEKLKLQSNPDRIVMVEVRGGVAEISVSPDDVDVYIVDWDRAINGHCAFCGLERLASLPYEDEMHPACREEYDRIKKE